MWRSWQVGNRICFEFCFKLNFVTFKFLLIFWNLTVQSLYTYSQNYCCKQESPKWLLWVLKHSSNTIILQIGLLNCSNLNYYSNWFVTLSVIVIILQIGHSNWFKRYNAIQCIHIKTVPMWIHTRVTVIQNVCLRDNKLLTDSIIFDISCILDAKYPRPSFEQGYVQTLLLWMITFSSSTYEDNSKSSVCNHETHPLLLVPAILFVKMHSISAHFCNLVLAMLPFTKHMMHYVTNDNY